MFSKTARKLTTSILCVALVLLLVACGGGGGSDAAVGSYDFQSMDLGGMSIDMESAAAMGLDLTDAFTFEIKADGTFTLKMAIPGMEGEEGEEETGEGTWKKDGDTYTLTVEGDDVTGKYDASAKTFTFTMEESGENMSLVFKKK